jgi:hypothetical protein
MNENYNEIIALEQLAISKLFVEFIKTIGLSTVLFIFNR